MGLLIVAVFIAVVAGSLWLVMGRIHYRAKLAKVSPVPALFVALFGYLVGVLATSFLGCGFLFQILDNNPSNWIILGVVVFCGVIGTTVGSGIGYIWIWFRTASDPDYDDLKVGSDSQVTDIDQSRDRDDFVADD